MNTDHAPQKKTVARHRSPVAEVKTTPATSKRRSKPFPIVAIGASAGGLDAMIELLKNLSPTTGMTFVYIQHLDPTHKSILSEILQKHTSMKVFEAQNMLKMEANHLFVIPPDKDMMIVDGVLKLTPRAPKPSIHLPVNRFFLSLADKQKEGSIGVVLSGNASDGTIGLRAIKEAGGLTFAQDDSAKFPGMPKSAIGDGAVDFILPPKEIAKELERIARHGHKLVTDLSEAPESAPQEVADEDVLAILQLLKRGTNVDFTHYKVTTVRRRILRRMLLHKLESLRDYITHLRKHPQEVEVLFQDLLITVTSFFRDPETLECFKKKVLPGMLKDKSPSGTLRIWIPACSGGMETYSLAMTIMEALGDKQASIQVQIFATDLSETQINRARLGMYLKNEVEGVSPRRLKRFFTKTNAGYHINKAVRDLCVFAVHDVTKDPPFSRLDIISCCNLLIYFDTHLQKKLLSTFHYSLNTNGVLLLGKSESISAAPQLFSQIDKKHRVYLNKKNTSRPVESDYRFVREATEQPKDLLRKQPKAADNLETMVDTLLLAEYVPASILVNKDLEIELFRGAAGLFLDPSAGKASLNLIKMAPTGLGFELRNAINKASRTGNPVQKTDIEVRRKGKSRNIAFEAVPMISNGERYFLILFEEINARSTVEQSPKSKDKLVKQLTDELAAAREDYRGLAESQELVNEELQSANEEIVSSNEELQSVNEELETSKEEIESSNEELLMINNELQIRNDQLSESQEYIESVFSSLREAVLVLDRTLRIQSANATFYKTFQVTEFETIGKYIFDLDNGRWSIPKLRVLLEEIVPRNKQFENFEITLELPNEVKKVLVLNAKMVERHAPKLILLAIEDVTEKERTRKLQMTRHEWSRNLIEAVPVMIWAAGPDMRRTFVNKTMIAYTGKEFTRENDTWLNSIHPDDRDSYIDIYTQYFSDRMPFKHELRLHRHDGVFKWIRSVGYPTYDAANVFTGYVGAYIDIHDEKMEISELKLRLAEAGIIIDDTIQDTENDL